MYIPIILVLVVFSRINLIGAIQLDKRSESKCELIGNSIYCFGGYLVSSGDANLYSLNVVDFVSNKSMINLAKGWNLVQPDNPDYVLEPRRRANAALCNNRTSLLIVGGYTYNQTTLQNQTIVYHTNTNTWETLSNYTDRQGRMSQIYNAAVTSLMPNEDSVSFYGGNTQNPTFNESGVPIQTDSSDQTVTHQGFTSLTVFRFETKQWSTQLPQTNAPTNIMYSAQTVTFNPKSSLIYYLGGFFSASSDYSKENKMSFSTANVFDMKSGAWNVIKLGGSVPKARLFPTATLMPNSDDILLYGGTDNGNNGALNDFCYTLNLASNNWTRQSIDVIGVNSPSRFAHSAVLVNNSLFIMFGLAAYANPFNDILVLDVKNVNNLYFPDTYPYIEREAKPVPSAGNATVETTHALSHAETAGIAVACSVVGLGIIAAAIFFYIRKKKQDEKKVEEMSVDWDQVENFYTEEPIGSSTQFQVNEKYVSMTTLNASPASPLNGVQKSNPNQYTDDNYTKDSSTVVNDESHKERLSLVKPSAINENDQRIVCAPDIQPPAIVKPDHGSQ